MKRRIFGGNADQLSISSRLNGLARLSQERGQLVVAEHVLRKSITMKRRIHGESKVIPDITLTLHRFAKVVRQSGKLEEAEILHQDSSAMMNLMYEKKDCYEETSFLSTS